MIVYKTSRLNKKNLNKIKKKFRDKLNINNFKKRLNNLEFIL